VFLIFVVEFIKESVRQMQAAEQTEKDFAGF
jgi:hypothetical protein